MLAKRIIPCLDVTGGRVVKGVNFVQLRDAGDPVEVAARYNEQGADELTFLDITATSDGRDLILHIIEAVASQVFIPLTVGGGVRTVEDVRRLLNAGADKTSFNSAAIANPDVIGAASARYGAQCIVVAIDAKRRSGADAQARGAGWDVYSHGGRRNTGLDAVQWACEMGRRGAGEILLTSMDRDGTGQGFDLELLRAACAAVRVPVVASGGVGSLLVQLDNRAGARVVGAAGGERKLRLARELGASEVDVVNDSELVAKQITGAYKVKHADMKPLHREAMNALRTFERWSIRSVPRAQNAHADALVNAALDAA
ncbi:MAG: hypothetical protein NVS2B4_17760 [Ramlibacter sp.]